MLFQFIISLPMMLCFFWSIFFMVRFHRGSDEPHVTGTILLFYIAATILYADHWLYFSGLQSFWGEYSYSVANLCVYPLYYAYLRAITRTKKNIELPLLFLPAVLVALLFPLGAIFRIPNRGDFLIFARVCFAIEVIWVWWRGYQILKDARVRMDDAYSDDRSYLLHPLYLIQHFLGVTAGISMLLNLLGRDFFASNMMVTIPAVLMSVLLYGLGYVAAHTTIPRETIASEEQQIQEPTPEETDELMMRISAVLREQKLFVSPELTIQDLAAAVHSNRTYVSQCINRRTGLSFSQLVTRYRVENAELILRSENYSSDHEAIADAMELSGFNSDKTFYRAFKEITGETPLQYRHNNLQ